MYTSAADFASACLVGLHSGPSSDDSDFQASFDAFEAMSRRGIGPLPVAMLVLDPGLHTPNSAWRKKFAGLRRAGRSRHRIAMVTNSRLARGVITAIDWLQPPDAEQQLKAWASIDEAIAWLERERSERLPLLRKLYETARKAGVPLEQRATRDNPEP